MAGLQHREPARFVADTLLLEGYGFEPPRPVPELGVYHSRLPDGSTLEDLVALHDPTARRSV